MQLKWTAEKRKATSPLFYHPIFFPLLPPCFYSFGSGITVIPTDTKCNYLNDGTTGQILFSDYAFLRIENGGQSARPPFFSSVLSTCETVWSFSFFLSFFSFVLLNIERENGERREKRKKEERNEKVLNYRVFQDYNQRYRVIGKTFLGRCSMPIIWMLNA